MACNIESMKTQVANEIVYRVFKGRNFQAGAAVRVESGKVRALGNVGKLCEGVQFTTDTGGGNMVRKFVAGDLTVVCFLANTSRYSSATRDFEGRTGDGFDRATLARAVQLFVEKFGGSVSEDCTWIYEPVAV